MILIACLFCISLFHLAISTYVGAAHVGAARTLCMATGVTEALEKKYLKVRSLITQAAWKTESCSTTLRVARPKAFLCPYADAGVWLLKGRPRNRFAGGEWEPHSWQPCMSARSSKVRQPMQQRSTCAGVQVLFRLRQERSGEHEAEHRNCGKGESKMQMSLQC